MISMILPLAVGNALRVFLAPPADALKWRILRKLTDDFAGENDPAAFLVYEGDDRVVVDIDRLKNGTSYVYRVYYWDGVTWTPSASESGIPNAIYDDWSTDAMVVLRDRIVAGLSVEVGRGAIKATDGQIKVLVATPLTEEVRFPLVTLHLMNEAPIERGIGEQVQPDDYDGEMWNEYESWLASVQIAVIGWSLNPDERITLRKILRRIIVANLPVFDSRGMVRVEFQQQDVDAVSEEYSTNIFQAMGTFTCEAPVVVRDRVKPITDVEVQPTFY